MTHIQESYKRVFRHSEREHNKRRQVNLSPFVLTNIIQKLCDKSLEYLNNRKEKEMEMDNIKLYRVSNTYVEYLLPHAPHLYHNSQTSQQNERPYIGVVLHINNLDYFAPLSSFKEKHRRMSNGLDFIKVKNYAVINLNNMFPVPQGCYTYINISKEHDPQYKALLLAEYRCLKSIQDKIRKNALTLYRLKIKGEKSSLTRRCNDFLKLETLCKKYK